MDWNLISCSQIDLCGYPLVIPASSRWLLARISIRRECNRRATCNTQSSDYQSAFLGVCVCVCAARKKRVIGTGSWPWPSTQGSSNNTSNTGNISGTTAIATRPPHLASSGRQKEVVASAFADSPLFALDWIRCCNNTNSSSKSNSNKLLPLREVGQ